MKFKKYCSFHHEKLPEISKLHYYQQNSVFVSVIFCEIKKDAKNATKSGCRSIRVRNWKC